MLHEIAQIVHTLKAERLRQQLSQRALSKRVGIPQSHISKIENGGVDLTLSSLIQLARALDLEPMLVPRTAIPAIQSIIRSTKDRGARISGVDLKIEGQLPTVVTASAYSLDEDDDA